MANAAQSALMDKYLEFSKVHKVYPTPTGPLTVVEDFDLKLRKGEFISLIGHSGCGKSTALTMVAGLNEISKGAIKLDGLEVKGADPERAVVFQAPSLFPWLTAKENVAIGVDKVYPKASREERQDVVEYYLERVGLADAMDKPAVDLSNGMKQRVGIARAFALSPKLLLLDEPFGMLDSLTRWELQEVLMEVWSRTKVTAICVTHDVDEAILPGRSRGHDDERAAGHDRQDHRGRPAPPAHAQGAARTSRLLQLPPGRARFPRGIRTWRKTKAKARENGRCSGVGP